MFKGAARLRELSRRRPSTRDVNKGVLHTPAEVGQDAAYAHAQRDEAIPHDSAARALASAAAEGPYFHDGKAASLADVVDHYVQLKALVLTPRQRADLIEYLKSL